MRRIYSLLLLLSTVTFSQVEYSGGQNTYGGGPAYYLDLVNFKGTNPERTRVDIFVQIPYSSLSFVKKDNQFSASYSVAMSLYDEKKENILTEKSWREKLNTKQFSETLSRNNFSLSYKNWDLAPGKYVVRFLLEDGDSRRTSQREINLNVRRLSDSLEISDLVFISQVMKDTTGDVIIPNISNLVTNKDTSISFYYYVYSNREQEVFVEYYLEDLNKKHSTKQLDPQKLKAGANLIRATMKNLDFSLGHYELKAVLKDKDWKEIKSVNKKFQSKIYGVPGSINDLDKAISQLIYIAAPDERDYIEDGKNYEEKMNRFLAFWDKKKPNPNAEENPILYEYYRRIEYANKNFKGISEGWRSDMGMIYVTFGPPGNVERHPYNADSKPYEIWDYYDLNRSFVFIDETGFGDYRLYNPDYSRWPGYRP